MTIRRIQAAAVTRKHPLPSLLITTVLTCWPTYALAYTWMIRHNFTGCAECHADPSGAGLLTDYGRAQSELVLRTPYPVQATAQEAGPAANFLWGTLDSAVKLPDWLLLGGAFRGAELATGGTGQPSDTRAILMQADLYAQATAGRFKANVSVGFAATGARLAALTNNDQDNVISRTHWVGVELAKDTLLLRAGRLNLPFGLRNIEHTSWVRTNTRTDTNSAQQYGVALAYTGERLRGELMAIAGNFLLRSSDPRIPADDYRDRGYSGLLEYMVAPRAAIGVSSLITHANRDQILNIESVRHAHGVFARYAPIRPIVLLFEADLLLQRPSNNSNSTGYTGFFQIDWELLQGVHLMPMVEVLNERRDTLGAAWGYWITADWFFAPHTDIRLDFFDRRYPFSPQDPTKPGATFGYGFLAQLHFFL